MWLLENDGDLFKGKKLWLRPGKRYLFGRTRSEDGQFVVPDKNISRKHLTIEVANVPDGKASDPENRSVVTLEDLKTKQGTLVNGKNIQSERFDLIADENEIRLGRYDSLFRITWHSVVLSFSFTKAEMEKGPLKFLQQTFEPLDVKYVVDNKSATCTHVVSKKRNTSRVLQALINGRYVISQDYTDAILRATTPQIDASGAETSPLETDFEANWPDATKYPPPHTEDPAADRPDGAFAPDERRREIFDGYTFIFYERMRYEELRPVITGAKGKALLREVKPGRTDIDDFIRYVKSVAGEKGLGEFEDGSEGRGVVVVRFVPPGQDANAEWYLKFYNEVALRLDHRPIEGRDFLPAILDVEAAQLRRPLEIEPTPRESAAQDQSSPAGIADSGLAMDVDEVPESPVVEATPPPRPLRRRAAGRRGTKSRFKGFDVGSDGDDDDDEPVISRSPRATAPESQAMFMTQPDDAPSQVPQASVSVRSQRKRPAPIAERDIMEEVAPTAARIKRIRLEGGEDPISRIESTPPPAEGSGTPDPIAPKGRGKATKMTKGRKGKKTAEDAGDELIDQLIAAGQEEEAQRQADDELLRRQLLEGAIDLGEIRHATTVQTISIRRRPAEQAHEQDSRWDPKWNGLTNFKKFRKQTDKDEQARPRPRKIVSLEPVKAKEYGISDEYWLQRTAQKRRGKKCGKGRIATQTQTQPQTQTQTQRQEASQAIELDDDSEEDGDGHGNDVDNSSLPDVTEMESNTQPSRSRRGKAAEKASQSQAARTETRASTQMSTQKRGAPGPPSAEKPAKKRATRATRAATRDSDGDEDSEDGGMGFRFGKRR